MEYTNEILNELKKLNKNLEKQNQIKILKAKDVAEIIGVNINRATEIMKRPNFPSIKDCGSLKVEEKAFINWLRSEEDEEMEEV